MNVEEYRPVESDIDDTSAGYQLPAIMFSIGGRIGVVQSLYTHPDNGTVFDAQIRFNDGSIENWRGKNMRGLFYISEKLT